MVGNVENDSKDSNGRTIKDLRSLHVWTERELICSGQCTEDDDVLQLYEWHYV